MRPASRFASDDLPAPEEPSRTKVFAGSRSARTSSIPSPVTLLTARTRTPTAIVLRLDELPGIVEDVELREHDHRIRTAVPCRGEVALEPTRVEVGVEPRDEEDDVDVRDQDVLLGPEPRRLARDLRAAWEQRLDRELLAGRVADDDPVADRGHAAPDLVVAQPAARVREPVAELGAHVVAAAMLRDDAGGAEPTLLVGCEGRLELVRPAQLDERRRGQGSIGHVRRLLRSVGNQTAARRPPQASERFLRQAVAAPERCRAQGFHSVLSSRSTTLNGSSVGCSRDGVNDDSPMPTDKPELTEVVNAQMPLGDALGIRTFGAPDEVDATIAHAPELCTAGGVLHGGVVMTLADTAGAVCAFLNLPPGTRTVTIESKTNFLGAIREGEALARARPLHVGRTTIVVETDVLDADGRRVARTTQTQAVLPE